MGDKIGSVERRVSRKATAVHEAGHLYVNIALKPAAWVDSVWVKQASYGRGQWEGAVEYKHRFQWTMADMLPITRGKPDDIATLTANLRENARRELLITLSGPIAELRWRNRSRWGAIFAGGDIAEIALTMGEEASSDFGSAKRLIEWLDDGDHLETFRTAWLSAEEILHANWQRILFTADRLQFAGFIGEEEANSLEVTHAIWQPDLTVQPARPDHSRAR